MDIGPVYFNDERDSSNCFVSSDGGVAPVLRADEVEIRA